MSLNQRGIKVFLDLLIMATDEQLEAMRKSIKNEIVKREKVKARILEGLN